MRARLRAAVLVAALLTSTVAAQRPGWEAATGLYLDGRAEAALDMIATLPRDEARDGARKALEGFRDRRRAQALLALWTEVHVELERGLR